MDDADEDPEFLVGAHGVGAIQARLHPHFAQEFVEVIRALLQRHREGIILGDHQGRGEVAVLHILMQGVALIREARVQRLRQEVHVRLGRLPRQGLDAAPHLLQARAVRALGQVDGVVVTDPDEGVEPDEVRFDRLGIAAVADDLAPIGVGALLEILQGLQRPFLHQGEALGRIHRSQLLQKLEVRPVVQHLTAKDERAGGARVVLGPSVDHRDQGAIGALDHLIGLLLGAAGQRVALELGLAPAVRQVGVHAGGEQEEDLFIHLGGRTEHLLDVRVAVGLGVAVGEVEGRDDLPLVAGRDLGGAEERHHLGQAVDVALHHDRRHRNAGIFGEAIFAPQFLRHQRIMGLRPSGQEIFGQGDAGGRMALGELRDPLRSGFEVGARDDGPREARVQAVPGVGTQRLQPFAHRREAQQFFRLDGVGVVVAAARAATGEGGALGEGRLHFVYPLVRHGGEQGIPRAGRRVGVVGDEGREHGLGAQVFRANGGLGTRIGLDLTLEAGHQPDGHIGLRAEQVAEESIEVGGLHLGQHAGQVAGGLGLVPIVDLIAVEEGDVLVPHLLDLLALRKLAGLFSGQESGELLAQGLIFDVIEPLALRQVSQRQLLEATRQKHAPRGQTAGRILTPQLGGAAAQPLGQPEGFARGDAVRKEFADLAQLGVVEFAGQRIDQGQDVIELHAALLTLREVGQHLVEDASRQFGRQLAELGADLGPIAEPEAMLETRVGGRGGIDLAGALKGGEDLGQVARELVLKQVLILRLRLRVEGGGRLRGGQGRQGEHGEEESARERGSHGLFVL